MRPPGGRGSATGGAKTRPPTADPRAGRATGSLTNSFPEPANYSVTYCYTCGYPVADTLWITSDIQNERAAAAGVGRARWTTGRPPARSPAPTDVGCQARSVSGVMTLRTVCVSEDRLRSGWTAITRSPMSCPCCFRAWQLRTSSRDSHTSTERFTHSCEAPYPPFGRLEMKRISLVGLSGHQRMSAPDRPHARRTKPSS